jgi:hypothetical protein
MDGIKLLGYKVRTLIYVNVFPNFITIVTYYYWYAEEQNKYCIQIHLYWYRKQRCFSMGIIHVQCFAHMCLLEIFMFVGRI